MVLNMETEMFNNIKTYCSGKVKFNMEQEKRFLSNINLHKYTGVNLSKNSGKISEWYVGQILREKGIKYNPQPIIKYGKISNKKQRFLQPDFYIPSKNMFIEVKSRTYNCGGTSSEKIDHVARKYSTKLTLTNQYKKSKVLVVFCAGELFEESTLQLINYKHPDTPQYVKNFVQFTKKHNVLDWININEIDKYI
jgi:hypothetical protein